MGRKLNTADWKKRIAKDYILANPKATISMIVKVTQVSARTVSKARAELVATGQVEPAFGDWKSMKAIRANARAIGLDPKPPDAPIPTPDKDIVVKGTTELLGRLDAAEKASGTKWPIERRMKQCQDMADDPTESPQVRLAAMNMYNNMESKMGDTTLLGPGKPLTNDDKVKRLALLLEACDLELSNRAWTVAFGEKGGQQDVEVKEAQTSRAVQEPIPPPEHSSEGSTPEGPSGDM